MATFDMLVATFGMPYASLTTFGMPQATFGMPYASPTTFYTGLMIKKNK
jgi:hypothetical protein